MLLLQINKTLKKFFYITLKTNKQTNTTENVTLEGFNGKNRLNHFMVLKCIKESISISQFLSSRHWLNKYVLNHSSDRLNAIRFYEVKMDDVFFPPPSPWHRNLNIYKYIKYKKRFKYSPEIQHRSGLLMLLNLHMNLLMITK